MIALLFSLVLAQEAPSAARLCADAAAGAELDVCLSLAAEHPEQLDGITAALKAHIDRGQSPDRELMRAILALASDDDAVWAAGRLALLDDPRGIEPLVVAATTREPDVVEASVAALARFPQTHEQLIAWLLSPEQSHALRAASARALAEQGGEVGGDALMAALRRRRVAPELREVLLDSLEERFPERYAALGSTVQRDGTPFLVATGALTGGQALGALGYAGDDALAVVGATTGTIAGGTIGWVVGRRHPMEQVEAAFLASSTSAGITTGAMLGTALTDGEASGAWVGSTVGNAVGLSLGAAFRRHRTRTTADVLEANLFALTAAAAGGSGLNFARKISWGARVVPDPIGVDWGLLGAGIGYGTGHVIGAALAPQVSLTKPDVLFIALTSSFGLGLGMAAPVSHLRRGLPLAGLTTGMLVGYAVSTVTDPRPDAIVGATTGALYGGALGSGIGMLVDAGGASDGIVPRGYAVVGSGIGMGVGAAIANGNPEFLDPADLAFVTAATAAVSLQSGALWAGLAPPLRTRGWFVVGPAALGSIAAITTPLVDIPTEQTFAAASIGAWGGWFGFGSAALNGGLRRDRYLWAMAGADIGIAAGLVSAMPPFNVPPVVLAFADVGGLLGGSSAALITGVSFADPDSVVLASVAGSAVGLIVGASVGTVVHLTGREGELALRVPGVDLPGSWSATPTVLAAGDSMVPGVVLVGVGF